MPFYVASYGGWIYRARNLAQGACALRPRLARHAFNAFLFITFFVTFFLALAILR
jgi:hypothetical protein